MLSTRKTLHSSQIQLLQPMLSVSRRFRMLSIRKTLHSNQIYLLQSMSYAEHTENSVPYPDFLLRSFLHFERFLTIDQLFWLTTTAIPQYFSKSFSSPSLRVSDNLRSFFGNFHRLLQLRYDTYFGGSTRFAHATKSITQLSE